MLGFYVLLEDPDANIIIALALHIALLQLVFFLKVMTYAILLISPGPWLQAKTQQPIGVVGPVIIHVNGQSQKLLLKF